MAGEEPAGLPGLGEVGLVGRAPGLVAMAEASPVNVELGVLLSAVMAVNVGSADDDPLKMDVIVASLEAAEVREAIC